MHVESVEALVPKPISARQAPSRLPTLTERQREIVALLGEGMTNREIAIELGIRPATVKRHLERIYARVGIHTRAGVTAYCMLESGSFGAV